MKKTKEHFLIEIYSGILWQAEMVKDLLENEGIKAYLKDEITGSLNLPWDGLGSVKVVISNLDYEQAIVIVEKFNKSKDDK
ncbi:MAG: DUF2007 domain-containing protein [Bacteroidetes bacterium]|nr:DUF2007 domain-containing protein [Bacteroidota bacterium]